MAAWDRSSYARRKKGTARNGMLLVVLLFVGCALMIPVWVQHSLQRYVLPGVFLLVLLLGGVGGGLAIVYKRREQARLRAVHLADVDTMTGRAFEHYVAQLVQSQGYQVSLTKVTGDFGGDIVGRRAGVTTIMQVKRYKHVLGVEAIQQAVTAKAYYRASACMVITTSYFTKAAKELARVNDCVLIDRDTLANWIVAFQRARI